MSPLDGDVLSTRTFFLLSYIVPRRRHKAPDELRPRGYRARLLEEARGELPVRVYGRPG